MEIDRMYGIDRKPATLLFKIINVKSDHISGG